MASALVELLGSKLLGKDGTVDTASALSGKAAVALYFSAHWCPPCRGFTPKLAEIYKGLVAGGKALEIVFVSSDKDDAAFKEYFGEQPWLALPFEERDLKGKLSKKYKVSGIPTLVILDGATGETITTDGRSAVMEDPEGKEFPWKPPSLWESLGSEFLSAEDTVDIDDIKGKGKVIGLYFSAHWCPPCKAFTPQLVETYKKVKAAGKELEIIFVSSDRDAGQFAEYFGSMPWLAIPQGDARKNKLSKRYEVSGIPSLVFIDGETGETITKNGRGAVGGDPEGKDFPWYPKPVTDLAVDGEGLNEETCLCALLEGCPAPAQEAGLAALTAVATAHKKEGGEVLFFSATKEGEGPVGQIRKLCKVGDASPTPKLIMLDIPDDGGFYVSDATEVTEASVCEFLAAYKAGKLTRQQLG